MGDLPTKERLARELEAAGAPPAMVTYARMGGYDDYESDSPVPITDLVHDLVAVGADSPALTAIMDRAREGAFDATRAEADAWRASADGRATFLSLFHRGAPPPRRPKG